MVDWAFDNNRIVEYIKKWYAHTPLLEDINRDINAQKLAKVWKDDPTIEPLTGNPLLLSTLLMVHHLDGRLPNGRSQLYRRYIDGMLGIWDDRRKLSSEESQLSSYNKRKIIRNIALFMFSREEDQIDETIITNWLKSLLEKIGLTISSEDVLAHLRERSGLIVGPGVYSFIHKTVAEYLVAEAILDGNERLESGDKIDRFCLFQNRISDRWNTIIFLWAGLAPISEVESFIEQCINVGDLSLGYGILFDQILKLSKDTCRKFIFQYTGIIQDNFFRSRRTYFMAAGSMLPLEVPCFAIRGITESNDFHDLMTKMVANNYITWDDYNNEDGDFKELIWICFANAFSNLVIWTKTLKNIPFKETKFDWLYWTIDSAIYRSFHDDTMLNAVVNSFKDSCPEAVMFIPISLISNAVEVLSESPNDIGTEKRTDFLKYIPLDVNEYILEDYLQDTLNWSLENDGKALDLLETFINEMNELIKQGCLKEDDIFKSAINCVQELIVIRAKIKASNNDLNQGEPIWFNDD